MTRDEICEKAFIDMPMASEHTQTAYKTLERNFYEYIESLQETAFYHGYMTCMKDIKESNKTSHQHNGSLIHTDESDHI